MVDYVRYWNHRTEIASGQIVKWMGIGSSKFYDWKKRYGKVNEHNSLVPRDHWLDENERESIVRFHHQHLLEGYRRMTYMMIDEDVVAASPATVYRVLKSAGLLERWNSKRNQQREAVLFNLCSPTTIGMSTWLTSISAERFITCAGFWMAAAGLLFTAKFESR